MPMIRNVIRIPQINSFCDQYEKLLINYLKKIDRTEIENRLLHRNENASLDQFYKYLTEFNNGNLSLRNDIFSLLNDLPNSLSPTTPIGKEIDSRVVKEVFNNVNKFSLTAAKIGKLLSQMRIDNVTLGAEDRAYYFNGDLASLERALLRYTVSFLIENGFELVSVPDIINNDLLKKCGFKLRPDKVQVYNIATSADDIHSLFIDNCNDHEAVNHSNQPNEIHLSRKCLAGTSELTLAALMRLSVIPRARLPIKLCAVSRCYRREASNIEGKLYRVHQFNKVEMFCITHPDNSDSMLDYLVELQEKILEPLQISYRILDMASEELGDPAYKKIDIESWMPAENIYGEISSASNCTDYQARQLQMFYETDNKDIDFVHTLNGTGCAIPRLMKTILETYGEQNGRVSVPPVLRKYMRNVDKITRQHPPHKLIWTSKIVDKSSV